jgi:hypothetical protein
MFPFDPSEPSAFYGEFDRSRPTAAVLETNRGSTAVDPFRAFAVSELRKQPTATVAEAFFAYQPN